VCNDPEKDGLAWYWKTSRTDETAGKEVIRIDLGKKEEVGHCPANCVK
jgi:hypothetical protein